MKAFLRKELYELLDRYLGREEETSKAMAKDRLRFILVQDRSHLGVEKMEALRNDLLKVLAKYVELDQGEMDIQFEQDGDSMALVANVPIQTLKRSGE